MLTPTHDLIGNSGAMSDVIRFIAKAAPANSNVLIYGESGTGKELVARALHQNSRRARGPFIAVNCAALPEALLESQLFGHERGAFTGAVAQQKGKFELAAGGTLFLDEVGELGLPIQAKLLRAIQEKEVDRLGRAHPVPVDIRIVAATNRSLGAAVAEGAFREDLYHRLKVLPLRMPALRERREDIPALARHFLTKYAEDNTGGVRQLSTDALSILQKYDWPGNVRELQNVIEHAIVLGSSNPILPGDLPAHILQPVALEFRSADVGMRDVLEEVQRCLYKYALAAAEGNYVRASAMLKVNPKGIHRSLKSLGLMHLLR